MLSLEEVLVASKRNFLMIAHRARSDGSLQLNDLCGASGRWDAVARAITSALFLSHDMRRDTSIHILLLGPEDPPKLLSIIGGIVKYLNPDERASSALMRKCLSESLPDPPGSVIHPSPGIFVARADLELVLGSFKGTIIEMHETGPELEIADIPNFPEGPVIFVLSDDQELKEEEAETISMKAASRFKVGDTVLHSHMVITIVHFLLDKYLH